VASVDATAAAPRSMHDLNALDLVPGQMFRGLRIRSLLGAGAGVGGVPHGLGARLMLEAIRTFASFAPRHTRSITIALLDDESLAAWCTGLLALDVEAVLG